jgi:hypothetical protein
MNAPKRWSSAGSEVDPVIRSLIGYAKSRTPSAVEVERLVTNVTARHVRPWALRVKWRARLSAAASFAVAVACGGLAWAGFGQVLEVIFPTPPAASARVAVPRSPATPPIRAAKQSPSPAPDALAVVPPSVPSASTAQSPLPVAPVPATKGREPSPRAASNAMPAAAVDDVAMLAEARKLLASDPASALALTEKSARENPRSQFAEERSAIGIEALARLGRSSEAELRLDAFERSFPESLYRRRLRAGLAGR